HLLGLFVSLLTFYRKGALFSIPFGFYWIINTPGVFDFPFLFAKCPRCPSVIVGDFETFHAEFRSFSILFLRSSITGVGTAYAKVNFSMSMYIER
ncbi:hypothetical protein, partial [Geobacillus zalihae]|uniref:hypothetical protein n=1 Tax=Geobacillus zalihae TaxID=213419 RepID=UPI001A97F572